MGNRTSLPTLNSVGYFKLLNGGDVFTRTCSKFAHLSPQYVKSRQLLLYGISYRFLCLYKWITVICEFLILMTYLSLTTNGIRTTYPNFTIIIIHAALSDITASSRMLQQPFRCSIYTRIAKQCFAINQ